MMTMIMLTLRLIVQTMRLIVQMMIMLTMRLIVQPFGVGPKVYRKPILPTGFIA